MILKTIFLDSAIYFNAKDFNNYYERGKTKIILGLFSEAIADLDSALFLNQNYAPRLDHTGLAKFKLCQINSTNIRCMLGSYYRL